MLVTRGTVAGGDRVRQSVRASGWRASRHGIEVGRVPGPVRCATAGVAAQADGHILLNPVLIVAPLPCIEYVVVHELCHLKEHNHGPTLLSAAGRHDAGLGEQTRTA